MTRQTIFPTLAASALVFAASASAQQQVRVTGTSSADQVLIKDTLQTILQFSYSRDGCQTIGEVTPVVLNGYTPAKEAYRTEEPDVIYERWDVQLCDKTETFLLAFWPSEAGGMMFKISFPPPNDLPGKISGQTTKSSIGT